MRWTATSGFGPYNRPNQNGPAEMGWRTTAQNYNLNRDWLKADAPETRADVRTCSHRWMPDLFVDVHTTDGADYQYDTDLQRWRNFGNEHPAVVAWQKEAFDGQHFSRAGRSMGHKSRALHRTQRPRDDPQERVSATGPTTPRFSTGYAALCATAPALAAGDTHAQGLTATRVTVGTYDVHHTDS